MAQWVKDLVLPKPWLKWDPCPGNFHMHATSAAKKKKIVGQKSHRMGLSRNLEATTEFQVYSEYDAEPLMDSG